MISISQVDNVMRKQISVLKWEVLGDLYIGPCCQLQQEGTDMGKDYGSINSDLFLFKLKKSMFQIQLKSIFVIKNTHNLGFVHEYNNVPVFKISTLA